MDPSQRLLNLLEVRLYILQTQNLEFQLAHVQCWDDTSSSGVRKILYLVISRFLNAFLALEQPRFFILLQSFCSLHCSQHLTFIGWVIYSFISCQLWHQHHLPLPMFLSILPFFPVSMARRSWILIPWGQGLFFVEFACPPRVCVGSLCEKWMDDVPCRCTFKHLYRVFFSKQAEIYQVPLQLFIRPIFFSIPEHSHSQCWCNRCWWDVSQRHYGRPKNNTPAFIHPTGFPDYPL